ncbi:pyridoxamine 5'-phosphate oxidase family protein, partial [Ilumatobacter sp.]|uniref:pyridoxamine 5'-phosphate oxidase family protein n=1 Tax=Ilumatobacter sp. TaxID=1967498 RepID=UPI003C32FDEC
MWAVVVLTDEMRQMVDAGLGFVATINADGTPNLSPKGTLATWDDDHLVFVDIASPNTSANLERNPSVEINVVDPLIRRGYRFAGTAVVHRGGSVFERGVGFYEDRGTVEA